MQIQFSVRFHTHPGESLHISFKVSNSTPETTALAESHGSVPLQYKNDQVWEGSLEADPANIPLLRYHYVLNLPGNKQISEGGGDREIDLSRLAGAEVIRISDAWNNPAEYENVFFTAPFREVFFSAARSKKAARKARKEIFSHRFKIKAPLLKKNEVVCLAGSGQTLGDWSTEKPLLMTSEGDWWSIDLQLPENEQPAEYKYGVYDIKKKSFLRFENGSNRLLPASGYQPALTILHDGFIYLPNNTWKAAGVSIPVFSLRSKQGFGVGEINDLKLLGDWAAETGLQVIQILPINDTIGSFTWADSYPYAAISSFALHPLYINLETVAGATYSELVKPLKKKRKELNELPDVDYEEVMRSKMAVLKVLFAAQKDEFLQHPDFLEFFEHNKSWLVPYAVFSYLRDRHKTTDYSQWKIHRQYNQAAIEKYAAPRTRQYKEIATYYFIQYHLHLQLKEAVRYLHKKGIILKGDIPIGINRLSCDAWMEPELFKMDQQAGAPPDAFAVKGQNWGFPTYNWNRMAEDGFQWWRRRFEQMHTYFDAFRIDHILGFFRIWSIPEQAVEGILGYFDPAIPVHISELEHRGIRFNRQRFTRPYITDAVVESLFGDKASLIKENFLVPLQSALAEEGYYELKPAFETQRQIENWFATLDDSEENRFLKAGLFDLVSNVILLEAEPSPASRFHFRISMEDTSSFQALDEATRRQLKELYIDYFYRRQESFWREEGMRKLPALKRATNMLVCGEDLGMVPDCVPDVMRELTILSLEVQRMPKVLGKEFFHPATAPYLSIVTPSTHDMSTIRGWWEEDPEKTALFFHTLLQQHGEVPAHCPPWISRQIILQHLESPAMLSIFQLQDIAGMNEALRTPNPARERINIPAIARHYWRYRIPFFLEQLLKEKEFNHELKHMVKSAGRF